MFVRAKKSGDYEYLQIVENQRIDGKVRQQVVATLGRLDILQATGNIDVILSSCARFAQKVSVQDAHYGNVLLAACACYSFLQRMAFSQRMLQFRWTSIFDFSLPCQLCENRHFAANFVGHFAVGKFSDNLPSG